MTAPSLPLPLIEKETLVIRFAGDSGDGMQLTGAQFTHVSALAGNDVHTFADFPAEIRAPAGTLPGVSGFQLSFSSRKIHTAGDKLDALVALNPAALRVNINDLLSGGLLIVNSDRFIEKEWQKAHYSHNPLEDDSLAVYQVMALPLDELTRNAVKDTGVTHAQALKCKNFFALGIVYWLYQRDMTPTLEWLTQKFAQRPVFLAANQLALKAGYNYALTTELFRERYQVKKAHLASGTYRQITGNEALALGCAAVAVKAQRPFLLAGYPITPASTVLQHVAKYTQFGINVFQAEDEIAAIAACVGAAFGGSLALTITSGPGLDLKSEALGLAVMSELPLVVIDVQRAGPSTGMPTKTEQADLFAALYGRHGECPLPVLAAASPGDCFAVIIEAFRLALKYMTPVILLSDGYIAMGAEPWRVPDIKTLPDMQPAFHTTRENFSPYQRDPHTLARVWAIPGTPGLMHRIGGLEKDFVAGNISYEPDNHAKMVAVRAEKIARIAEDIPDAPLYGKAEGQLLVISWGGTFGSVLTAVEILQQQGAAISLLHLRHLQPFPKNLAGVMKNFARIIVPELNSGQLTQLLRAKFLVDAQPFSKITGKPFLVEELVAHFEKMLTI